MNLQNIKSVRLSLMKKGTNISEDKQEFFKEITATFVVPENFPREEKAFQLVLGDMYKSLIDQNKKEVDTIGIWISFNDSENIIDNALSIKTLETIEMYSAVEIYPIFEFFKMTLPEEING